MKILLYKVRKDTLFSVFEPIVVEPLELQYLKSALVGHDVTIGDRLLDRMSLKVRLRNEHYDVIVLNGYVTAEDKIIELAKRIKAVSPGTRVIVSGVHAQMNPEAFRVESVDVIVKTQSLRAFVDFLELEKLGSCSIDGFDHRYGGSWVEGGKLTLTAYEDITPDRLFYKSHADKFRYMNYEKVALVKGSISCPFQCSYCYCRKLNDGKYIKRDYKGLFDEMATVDSEYYWVIDDTFPIRYLFFSIS